jgi:hypothetical protein
MSPKRPSGTRTPILETVAREAQSLACKNAAGGNRGPLLLAALALGRLSAQYAVKR